MKTREALLLAARAVFSEKGFERTSTPDIAKRADVSVGSFYRYFDDKREAFIEVVRRYLVESQANVFEEIGRALQTTDLKTSCRSALDVLFNELARLPDLERVYFSMSLVDREVASLRDEAEAKGLETLSKLLEAGFSREQIPDPRAAAYVMYYAAEQVALARGLRSQLPFEVDEEAVRQATTDMIFAFLRRERSSG